MNETHLKQAPIYAMKNKHRIVGSTKCGCYSCLEVFPKGDIKEWTDKDETALCPHCGVDAVIPDETGVELTAANLKIAHDFWFASKKA